MMTTTNTTTNNLNAANIQQRSNIYGPQQTSVVPAVCICVFSVDVKRNKQATPKQKHTHKRTNKHETRLITDISHSASFRQLYWFKSVKFSFVVDALRFYCLTDYALFFCLSFTYSFRRSVSFCRFSPTTRFPS